MYKNIIVLIFSLVLFSYCTNTQSKQKENNNTEAVTNDTISTLYFNKTVHDFGKINNNKEVSFKFEFKNLDTKPVIIQDVSTSCGCTISEWSKEPVEKGHKGFITIVFNPKNRAGTFNKSIFVKSTAQNNIVLLKIKGEIKN